jgi:hypothetical protein
MAKTAANEACRVRLLGLRNEMIVSRSREQQIGAIARHQRVWAY